MRRKEIASVMTPAERVIAVELDAHYKDVAKLLEEHRISAVPVIDRDSVVLGVVSEADILARGVGSDGLGTDDATALDVMTAPAVTVRPGQDILRAARTMLDHRLKRLVVTDEQDHLLGVVSRHDVLGYFARSDSDIRADIANDQLLVTLGVAPETLDVAVEDGVVRLGGRVATEDLAEIVCLVVGRHDGVMDVANELTYDQDGSTTGP
jgi:CBS-domain-containing membrane protein